MKRPTDTGGGTLSSYQPPSGHGQPRKPRDGFSVVEKDLIHASHKWDTVSEKLGKVKEMCCEGYGQATLFGMADALYKVGRLHGNFNAKIIDATADGSVVCAQVADGLVETANDLAATDKSEADNFQKLERK